MPTYSTSGSKYGLRALTGANVGSDIDAGFAALRDDIDANFGGYSQGTLASRPTSTTGTPGIAGRTYRATDTGQIFRDTGTSWVEHSTYSQGVLASRPVAGTAGREYYATDTKQRFKDLGSGVGWQELALVSRGAASVATQQTVGSVGPVDLTTAGPSVTIDVPDLGSGVGIAEVFASVLATVTSGTGIVWLSIDGATSGAGMITLLNTTSTGTYETAPGAGPRTDSVSLAGSYVVNTGGFIALRLNAGSHTLKLMYGKALSGNVIAFESRLLVARAIR